MPRPHVERPKRQRNAPRRHDYVNPYWKRHRYVTSTLTNEEHEALRIRAEAAGLVPTSLATSIIREFLAKPLNPDDFEDSPTVYAAEEKEEV